MNLIRYTIFCISIFSFIACNQQNSNVVDAQKNISPEGMVWIAGNTYERGAIKEDQLARNDEKPKHTVKVDGFWIDITEVTNKQYNQFVDQTGYVTIAERKLDWLEIKKQLPQDTPKPPDSIFNPGSLSFHCKHHQVTNLEDYSQWWEWKLGANWRQPQGKGSDIIGKENNPVVHIAYEDSQAYCKWIGRR